MLIEPAPLLDDIMRPAPAGSAFWTRTGDGIRIRMAAWRQGEHGTVLLFNGRTEYIEKFGLAAAEFVSRGFAFVTFDWRGQGLSDGNRLHQNQCHITDFRVFQPDCRAVMASLADLDLPQPLYLLAHSMGGCIALRSLHDGLAARAAAFLAPMWGIRLKPMSPRLGRLVTGLAVRAGFGDRYIPGGSSKSYIDIANRDHNALTSDRGMFDFLQSQLRRRPELSRGAPSFAWINASLAECAWLQGITPPALPALVLLGTAERVVDPVPIRRICQGWPGARLEIVPDARHELMMETDVIRQQVFDRIARHFSRYG